LSRKFIPWLCAAAAVLALLAAGQIVRYLMVLSSSKLANPPRIDMIVVILVVLVALAVMLAVVARMAASRSSRQYELVSDWSLGTTILWTLVLGYVLLVNYPVPATAHHADKFLFGTLIVLVWAAALAITPDLLKARLKSQPYAWLKVLVINGLVFVLAGEAALRLADPVLARSGLFGDKHTPASLVPHRRVEGSIGRTNSQGFRDHERKMERMTDAPRVVALGDSFTWGAGVTYDEAFVTVLERALQKRMPGAEIVNLGVPAWGPHEEKHLLETYGIRFRPDLVLLNFFVGNDIQNKRGDDVHLPGILLVAGQSYYVHSNGNWIHDTIGPERWYLYHDLNFVVRVGMAMVLKRLETQDQSTGVPLASFATYLKGIHERSDIYLGRDTVYFAHHWNRTQAVLEAMRDFLRDRQIGFLLVVIPDPLQLDQEVQTKYLAAFGQSAGGYDFEKPQRLLQGWAATHGVQMVDLLPAFKRHGVVKDLYFTNDVHLSAPGHAFAAKAILPSLEKALAGWSRMSAGTRP
jgi:lysophospholipase L1-like esterase